MTKKKLNKLKTEIESFRLKICNIKPNELERLAKSLGRRKISRGKEPTYESELLPRSRPLSIPNHPGALNKYTAGSILDQLDQDIFDLEEELTRRNNHEK